MSLWILIEVGGGGTSSVAPLQSSIASSAGISVAPTGGNDTSTQTATVALVLGVVYLAIGGLLDRRRLAGAATPFVALGALYTIVGAIALSIGDRATVIGLAAAAAGALVGLVGGLGRDRRGTTWIGVITVVSGLLAVIIDLAGNDTLTVAALGAAAALGLGALAFLLALVLGEFPDGVPADEG